MDCIFVSWNVNGLRSILKKGNLLEYIERKKPHILALQEIKAKQEDIDPTYQELLEKQGYRLYFHSSVRPWYSWTALLTKSIPSDISVFSMMEEVPKDDMSTLMECIDEGRVMTCEFNKFFFVNVYTPNAKHDLSRLSYRMRWDEAFLSYLKVLSKKKPVICCWDFNVAHQEIDLYNPQANKTTATRPWSAGFTDQERNGFQKYLDAGFIDVFRYYYPFQVQYTWWSNFYQARVKNIGWRIDYFLISRDALAFVKNAFIDDRVFGSDHCPVGIEVTCENNFIF